KLETCPSPDRERSGPAWMCRGASICLPGSSPRAPTICHQLESADPLRDRRIDDESCASPPRKEGRLRAPKSRKPSRSTPPLSESCTRGALTAGDSTCQRRGFRKPTTEKVRPIKPSTKKKK